MRDNSLKNLDSHPHGKNLRTGRFSELGRIYAITTVTLDRKPVFNDFSAARTLIQVLMDHERLKFAQTLCFVVMPDHLHWLMQLGEVKSLGETVQTLKSIISRKIGGPIFQKGFYDHALRKEEDIKALARYIVANPLRAGLVDNINDYPHWHAIWM
ncbi:MAG: transposase [Thermodesulfobacteriota bacterium]